MLEKNSDFCCEDMEMAVNDWGAVIYDKMIRKYTLHTEKPISVDFDYCPWCTSYLGKYLVTEWYAILEKEYGIKNPDIWELTNVPEEFKTDEWWRKRGCYQPYVHHCKPKTLEVKVELPTIKNFLSSLYNSVHFADPQTKKDPYKRISVDEDGQYVICVEKRITEDGYLVYSGYVAGWDEYDILGTKIEGLTPIMKETLYKEGLVLDMKGTVNPEFIEKLKNDAALRNKTEHNE